jgi:hypothetical protein
MAGFLGRRGALRLANLAQEAMEPPSRRSFFGLLPDLKKDPGQHFVEQSRETAAEKEMWVWDRAVGIGR